MQFQARGMGHIPRIGRARDDRTVDASGDVIGMPFKARGLIELTATGCRPSALGLRFLNDLLLEFMPENSKMTGSSTLSMTSHEPGRAASAPLYTGSQAPDGE